MKNNIMPYNSKKQRHGFWCVTYDRGILLFYKGLYINGVKNGYWQYHNAFHNVSRKNYYIK